MTAEEFEAKTGSAPIQDDLERVNCHLAGRIGHICCGWCDHHDRPMYECGCRLKRRLAASGIEVTEHSADEFEHITL